MMATWIKSKFTRSILAIYIVSPAIVAADCLGLPSSPILEIDIRDCEVATQFDNTLRIVGDARQVLTMFYSHATTSGNIEFVLEDNLILDHSFWASVAPGEGCKEFLEEAEEIWLFEDICNDTGQNVPDIQIMPLWPEIKPVAMKRLATRPRGDT